MEIQGYPNYLIYPNGDIFSKNKKRMICKDINKKNGYVYSHLCHKGKQKSFLNHRLVALHYIPNPENYGDVDHIDSVRTNNDIKNLRWCSRSQNNEFIKSKNYSPHQNGGFNISIKRNKILFRKYVKTEEEAKKIIEEFKIIN